MKYFLATVALAALLGGALARPAQAQGDERIGTAAATFLLVPPAARTAGLGNTLTGGLATVSGLEAAASNPAAMMTNTGTGAIFSRMDYVADIGVNYFGVAQRFGANNIALTITAWDYGDIARTGSTSNTDPGTLTYDGGATIVGATYARQFTDRIAAGITGKLVTDRIAEVNATTGAFDAGITYVVAESGLRFGVSLRNFGGKMRFAGSGLRGNEGGDTDNPGPPTTIEADAYELPSLLNFGASYTRQMQGNVSVTALANFRSNAYDQQQYAAGFEAAFANLFFVRGGYELVPDQDETMWQGWNVGGGLNLDYQGTRLGVDYTYRATDLFGGVNLFTANVQL